MEEAGMCTKGDQGELRFYMYCLMFLKETAYHWWLVQFKQQAGQRMVSGG